MPHFRSVQPGPSPTRRPDGPAGRPVRARRPWHDDWDDYDDQDQPWDPDLLDDEEPDPEPGDFWIETDDD